MINKFIPDIWKSVVPYHLEHPKKFRKRKCHIFNEWQPYSQRYLLRGLLPQAKKNSKD